MTSHGLMDSRRTTQQPRIDIGSLLVPTDPADSTVKLQVQDDSNTGVVRNSVW